MASSFHGNYGWQKWLLDIGLLCTGSAEDEGCTLSLDSVVTRIPGSAVQCIINSQFFSSWEGSGQNHWKLRYPFCRVPFLGS